MWNKAWDSSECRFSSIIKGSESPIGHDKKMINDAILEGLEIDFNFTSWDKEGKIILLFR